MGLGIKEMLRSVCCNNGWCYAIFWWSDRRNSMFLTPEDAYYEKQIGMEVDKMLQQVHMVGEGIIGQAAFTGKHRWILSDAYCGEWSSRGTVNNQVVFQDNAELQSQFSAGIKTIAIVNVATHGVVQLGSTQKILEKLEYVEQIRSLFQQMDSLPGSFLSGNAQKSLNGEIYDLRGAFATVVSSGNSYSTHAAINSFHDDSSKEMMAKVQSSTTLTHTLSPFSSGLNCGSMQPNVLAVPVISHSIPASNRYQLPSTEAQLASDFQRTSLFTRNSSFHLTNRYQLASAEAQVILSTPNIQLPQVLLQPNSSTSNYSTASNPSMSTWSSGVSSLTSMGQQLLSGIGLQGTPHMYPTNSHEVVPSRNLFNNSQRDSILTSLYSPSGSLDTMTNTGYGSGKLTDIRHSAPIFNEIEDELSTGKLYSRGAPFVPELSKESDIFHTFRGKFLTDNAALAISKSNPVNNQAHSTAQPLQQVNNTFAAPMDESLLQALGIVSPSSGLVGGDLCSGVSASGMPSSGQHTIADTVSSIAAACDRKENSSIASMQLPTDNDLFDSLGLDSKHSQGWVCWDNIEFPVGSGNLSNLSTGGSECISELIVDPMTGPEKGLFSKFDLEKLLEAAEGNVNPATNHNAEVHLPATTITRAGGMSAYNDHVPLAGLSCLSGSLDALLPESSSEKTLKEVLPKAQVSSWIGDTYSINAESSVTPQPERPEEHVKVTRKRARPGESTRPRPKDRQQIQDRVKELREIVPNGAKCSIDSLLDRTIKHMLFLQSVTKYADKLKQADEPKMIDKENCVVLKDNSSGSGATWAFEVGGQTMICPIIVEDLNPPGQMLVEMLCEERGFFLEIADIIRGFGLTILKGVMEVRDEKIWARFVVEANGGVTRMDIFLSLVQLLQQTSTCSIGSTSPPTKVSDSGAPSIFTNYQQSPMQVPISLSDRFQ